MCPVCVATAALITASATSGGGLAALVLTKFHARTVTDKLQDKCKSREDDHGYQHD